MNTQVLHHLAHGDLVAKPNMDRNALARIGWRLDALERGAWAAKAKGKHAGLLTDCTIRVGKALVALARKHGKVFPSLAGLAWLARYCERTVSTALNVLERLGFIVRHRR
ncbi:MAG TPA: helix-turn-helix domain-containing protein [Roseiarcus sp.]|jgi:hypothetical protein